MSIEFAAIMWRCREVKLAPIIIRKHNPQHPDTEVLRIPVVCVEGWLFTKGHQAPQGNFIRKAMLFDYIYFVDLGLEV